MSTGPESDGNVSLGDGIDRLLESLEPVSSRLGCHTDLMRVRELMTTGPSYLRQRQVYADTGDFRQVVASVVNELRDSVPVSAMS